jgi:hypothetical protein
LAADSSVPGYHDEWAYRDEQGKKIAGCWIWSRN